MNFFPVTELSWSVTFSLKHCPACGLHNLQHLHKKRKNPYFKLFNQVLLLSFFLHIALSHCYFPYTLEAIWNWWKEKKTPTCAFIKKYHTSTLNSSFSKRELVRSCYDFSMAALIAQHCDEGQYFTLASHNSSCIYSELERQWHIYTTIKNMLSIPSSHLPSWLFLAKGALICCSSSPQ